LLSRNGAGPNARPASWPAVNWRRELFRLWIVGTTLFVLAIAFISYNEIRSQFTTSSKKTFVVELQDGRTFHIRAPDMQTATAVVKKLPEGLVPDKPLLSEADVGLAPKPWATLATWAGIAFGIPLVVLILGSSLVWAFSGFAAKRP